MLLQKNNLLNINFNIKISLPSPIYEIQNKAINLIATKKFNTNFYRKYENIFKWSIKNPGDFWSSIWDFSEIKGIKNNKKIKRSKIFYKNKFLPNSKLNFAENLLSKMDKIKL